MPELDDVFATFRTEGTTVDPMPAAQVRRRGDRRRRRNHALASLGGVAAAFLVIGTPLAVLDSGDRDAPAPPIASSPAAPQWRQTVPGSFDLTPGINGADPAGNVTQESAPAVATIERCGEVVFDATDGTVDVLGASYRPAEPTDTGADRTLALYPDARAADQALTRIRTAATGCDTEEYGAGDTRVHELVGSRLPADDSAVLIERIRFAGEEFFNGELTVVQVARVGNALLVTEGFSAGPGADDRLVADEVRRHREQVVDVLDAMAVFAPSGTGATPAPDASDPSAAAGPRIPGGFDLLAG